MAIKTDDVDPLVGSVVSPNDQVGKQCATGANWIGSVGETADHDGGAASGSGTNVDLS